ncbi:MAG TPA: PAS domain S-box protein [Gillisia sp.]|nr:PAS domain S-box protein [Gillisia sp.]
MKMNILQKRIEHAHSFQRWSRRLAAAVMVLGILVLLGWTFDIDFLKRPFSGLVSMNPLTATCFILSSLSLFMLAGDHKTRREQHVGFALAYIVLAAGILDLGGFILSIDTPIDTWLFHSKLERDMTGIISNSMAPNTALGFILTALTLLFLNKQTRKNHVSSQYLALFISILAMIELLGYLFHVDSFYRNLKYFPMAIHTAIGFLLIAIALLVANPEKGFMAEFIGNSSRAVIARKMIPVAVIFPIGIGLIMLYLDRKGLITEELGIAMHSVANIMLFLIVIWFVIRELNRKDLQRKQAEDQMEQYRHFFNNSNDFSCIANVEGRFEIINPRFERVLGYSEKELLENQFFNFIHPDDIAGTVHEVEKLKSGATTINFINRYRKKNGEYLWFEWHSTPDPVTGKLYAIARDISERITIEENLEHSLKETTDYKYALDESGIVAITDQNGIINYANDNFCKISKYSREELIGQDHRIINSGYHPKEFIRDLWVTIAKGEIWRGEIKNKAKDGSYYWVDTSIIPFLTEQGKPFQYVVIRADITDRKRVEEQLLEINKELESFSHSVSHDLRSPLRAVNGYAKILQEDYGTQLDEEANRVLGNIMINANKMGQLIDDLLAFSRIGRKEIVMTNLDMANIVAKVRNELMSLHPNQNIEFKINELLPACGDPAAIKQVWTNLISNAIKYSSTKEKAIIEIGSSANVSYNHYYIKDNGAGFDMQYADKLFGVFQRLHSNEEFEGTGIGLALVQRIINKHGGRIRGEGKVGEGAMFNFTLSKSLFK